MLTISWKPIDCPVEDDHAHADDSMLVNQKLTRVSLGVKMDTEGNTVAAYALVPYWHQGICSHCVLFCFDPTIYLVPNNMYDENTCLVNE